jgi:ADP-ribose pyrophosphatase YjhB (NUDIX family)
MDSQDQFFAAVARRGLVRPSVRAIVRGEHGFLVQRPTDNPDCNYAFIGGEYELGDDFQSRLRREFEEETNANVVSADYRFVVENSFLSAGQRIQTLEHYLEVTLDRADVRSRERGLEQLWLAEPLFRVEDVRPCMVRDALLTDGWRDIRHLKVPG